MVAIKDNRFRLRLPGQPAAPVLRKLAANTSVSQHKTKRMCLRKWWLEKVCGIREREKKHFIIGHALHSVAERYLTRASSTWGGLFPPGWDKGLDEDERAWIQKQAELAVTLGMWQVSDGMFVEYPMALLVGERFRDARGMPLVCRARTYEEGGVRRVAQPECLYDGSPLPAGWDEIPPLVGFIDMLHPDVSPPWVTDHKTAKNRRYALTAEKLAVDLQVNVYAAVPLALHPEQDIVKLRHTIFLKSEDEGAYPVDAVTHVDAVRRHWDTIIADAKEMRDLRKAVPRLDGPDPSTRADNWQKVPCAIDAGNIREGCEAYGGCPFRDACFGRASMQQVVRRFDAPDPSVLARRKVPNYKLQIRLKPDDALPAVPELGTPLRSSPPAPAQPAPQENPMVFANKSKPATLQIPPLTLGSRPFLLDPENPQAQYRATVLSQPPASPDGLVMVMLWPEAGEAPSQVHIPDVYKTEVPVKDLSMVQLPGAVLTDYGPMLLAASVIGPHTWTDMVGNIHHVPKGAVLNQAGVQVSTTPAAAAAQPPAQEESKRPPADGRFALKPKKPAAAPAPEFAQGQKVNQGATLRYDQLTPDPKSSPQQTTLLTSPNVAGTSTPLPTGAKTKGEAAAAQMQRAQVAPETIAPPTFAPAARQRVQVLPSASPYFNGLAGKQGRVLDVSAGPDQPLLQVELDNGDMIDGAAAGRFSLVAEPAAAPDNSLLPASLEAAVALIGKNVVVRLRAVEQEYRCPLEAASENGIVIMQGKVVAPWEDVEKLVVMAEGDVPGRAPTPEEKKAARNAKKEADALASRPSPERSLAVAIETVRSTLTSGKVTRKVLEGLLPLLEAAQRVQGDAPRLDNITSATPGGAASPALEEALHQIHDIAGRVLQIAEG